MSDLDSPQTPDSRRLLALSQEKLQGDIEALRATEGWTRLSPRQQKLIEHSLYLQTRAERPDAEQYPESKERTAEWYCHAAIWSLEHEHSLTVDAPELDTIEEPFYDGEYLKANSFDALRDALTKAGFPQVVHIAQAPPPLTLLQSHTFLALGTDPTGDVVVWEKAAAQLPFQRSTLSKIYSEYTKDQKEYYWGIRPLRDGQQVRK
ncbi:hypothetical protein A2763_01415 [Candidatus Kaiserbacteria bacterium RIFCSPHIGHO2_01_FULL_54_36]|uniref:Uncharacterized protein n=1 Tax=Candidatus Kaiserbacteria bacterium RIFCSPHIGHO2_01_FULL_54_36 TaxID=1798482 RepID=A0A1F6CM23_9BACT|nr:MAG: hypothetical protein A2763_01415 [Candidatus Kaiserbacteria bacterium RIFCSPHIGHO2_01_FULL_54_36]OGG75776.1 MAG: hypothetical protein A3A41_00185 [Candidatus Kaiserbacteria bacterium RIFCSPLOWO2_01_FULL_54_22]